MSESKGLSRSIYRARYQIQESTFNYLLQGGKIGLAYVPALKKEEQSETKSKKRTRLRGLRYVDQAPLSDEEVISAAKFIEGSSEDKKESIVSLQELSAELGVGRLSKMSVLVHEFAKDLDIELVRYSCFYPIYPQTVLMVGLSRDLKEAFLAWWDRRQSSKTNLSRRKRSRCVTPYEHVSVEILSRLYPYNALVQALDLESEELFRVSPKKFATYLKQCSSSLQDDIKALYLDGLPVIKWAEKLGITKAAMYLRLERYAERFAKDKDKFLFGE